MLYYLLVKQHNKTGLKYLCQHFGTEESCFKYCGSGIYWKRHLKKYNKDTTTKILFKTPNLEELKQKGLYYSQLWNIVKSKEWANLCLEAGEGGLTRIGFRHSKETKQKMSLARKGMSLTLETKQKISKRLTGKNNPMYGKKHSIETKKLIQQKNSGETHPKFGKPLDINTKIKISIANNGKRRSLETKKKMSKNHKDFSGPNNPNWKGGHSRDYIRKSLILIPQDAIS